MQMQQQDSRGTKVIIDRKISDAVELMNSTLQRSVIHNMRIKLTTLSVLSYDLGLITYNELDVALQYVSELVDENLNKEGGI